MARKFFFIIFVLATNIPFFALGQNNSGDTTKLKEIVIEGQTVRHQGNQDEYMVTKQLREGTRDAGDLLGRLPGFFYNRLSRALKYQGSGNIKILVDSLDRDEEYIKRLNPKRFDKVYVISFPSGKYAGYDAVISLHTKPLYVGYEGTINGEGAVRMGSRNGKGKNMKIANGEGDFTYTREKWNFAVTGEYRWDRKNYLEMISEEYPYNNYKMTEIAPAGNEPDLERLLGRATLKMAADYSFNQDNILSLSVNSSSEFFKNPTVRNMHAEWGEMSKDFIRKDWNNYKNSYVISEILQYNGKIGSWWTFFSVGLNQVGNQRSSGVWQSDGFSITDNRTVRSNYGWANANISKSFAGNRLWLTFYDCVIWSNYRENRTETSELLSKSHDIRNTLNVSLSYYLSNKLSCGLNAGFDYIKSSSLGIDDSRVSPTFAGFLAWYPNRNVTARLNYNVSSMPAPLSQAQNYGQFTDSLVWHGGNPLLRPALNHTLTGMLTLWNCLSLRATYKQGDNAIFDIATLGYGERPDGLTGYYAKYQYENGKSRSWEVSATFNRAFGKHWSISATAGVLGMYGSWKDYSLNKTVFNNNWYVQYSTTGQSWQFLLSSALMPDLYLTPQYRYWDNSDSYGLTVIKNLFNNRLMIAGIWTLPFHFVKGGTNMQFNSEPLVKRMWGKNNFRDYNAIRVIVEYRFNGGERVRKQKVSSINVQL